MYWILTTTTPFDGVEELGGFLDQMISVGWPVFLAVVGGLVAVTLAALAIRSGFRRLVEVMVGRHGYSNWWGDHVPHSGYYGDDDDLDENGLSSYDRGEYSEGTLAGDSDYDGPIGHYEPEMEAYRIGMFGYSGSPWTVQMYRDEVAKHTELTAAQRSELLALYDLT